MLLVGLHLVGRDLAARDSAGSPPPPPRTPAEPHVLPPGVGANRISVVGFNPYRQQRRRRSDYLFVAAAFVVVAVLLLWALLPS